MEAALGEIGQIGLIGLLGEIGFLGVIGKIEAIGMPLKRGKAPEGRQIISWGCNPRDVETDENPSHGTAETVQDDRKLIPSGTG